LHSGGLNQRVKCPAWVAGIPAFAKRV
jgi:hypothetical protein